MPTKESLKILSGRGSETMTIKDARWACALVAVGTAIGSSMFTRKRVEDGKEPILKVFF